MGMRKIDPTVLFEFRMECNVKHDPHREVAILDGEYRLPDRRRVGDERPLEAVRVDD